MGAVTDRQYRVVVIGGGVVGCAVLRAFALAGARPLLLERAPDLLNGASKGNSAILHTGFDAPGGSLELACLRAGYADYRAIHERLNLPLHETGAMVVAWSDEELAALPAILAKAQENGVGDVTRLGPDELRAREPNLAADAKGAVLVPGEHVIDPWSAPLAYAHQALANGAEIRRGCALEGGRLEDGAWCLETTRGPLTAQVVINCAGLYGDLLEAICRPSPYTIRPRKGEFVIFDKPAARLLRTTILAVPSKWTKGVLLARTVFGNLLLGPTAQEQQARDLATVEAANLSRLIQQGQRILPGLAGESVTATFAGLRPASEHRDYQIEAVPGRNWISVGGIRSTGLSAALGIARHVRGLYEEHFGALADLPEPVWTALPNLCEYRPRPYQEAGSGEIVCHCELVTRKEIEAALSGPLPAADLGGLKRRTRCMLGRCQGFYCAGRIAQLTAGRFAEPLAQPLAGPLAGPLEQPLDEPREPALAAAVA